MSEGWGLRCPYPETADRSRFWLSIHVDFDYGLLPQEVLNWRARPAGLSARALEMLFAALEAEASSASREPRTIAVAMLEVTPNASTWLYGWWIRGSPVDCVRRALFRLFLACVGREGGRLFIILMEC